MKDRRRCRRFPIEFPVSFQMLNGCEAGRAGCGVTVNIGSRGLLLATPERLPKGALVELSVQWPAKLDNQSELKLVLRGAVVRSEPGRIAVVIRKYEFRVVGRAGLAVVGRRKDPLAEAAVPDMARLACVKLASQVA